MFKFSVRRDTKRNVASVAGFQELQDALRPGIAAIRYHNGQVPNKKHVSGNVIDLASRLDPRTSDIAATAIIESLRTQQSHVRVLAPVDSQELPEAR